MSEKSLGRTRAPYRNLWLYTFVSGTYGIGGVCIKPFSCTPDLLDCWAQLLLRVRVKPFSCTRNLVERRARLSLDSSYVDHVWASELTRPVSQRKNVVGHSRTAEIWFLLSVCP